VWGPSYEVVRHESGEIKHMTKLRTRGRIAAWLGALAMAVLLSSCSRSEKAEANSAPAAASVVAVSSATARDLVHQEVLAAEFRPFQVIDVHAKVAGYLKQIYVDVGDHVQQGQVLAVLEVPELADEMTRAEAAKKRSNAEVDRYKEELARAEAQHQATHTIYERLRGVSKSNPRLIAQQELDDAQARDLSAEANVSAARAALASAVQGVDVSLADVTKTQTMNSYARITAPFKGVITKRYADTGAMIPAGTANTSNSLPLVQLSQNDLLRLVLPVPESIVAGIKLGQTVDVRVKALNRIFHGKVSRFADTVNTSTRTMDTQIDVPNPSLILIPGMYAEAILTLEKRSQVLSIPLEGVNIQGNTATVYVVGEDHKIQVRQVKLGMETSDYVEIVSGLEPNELVVTGNRSQLTAGQQVTPKIIEAAKERKES
jgi:RND family efflux transporter MFP subunit